MDSRSKFIEAFHNLLHLTSIFYQEDDDTTRLADAFPVLNALKETHLLLAQGAHNQFGDLPWTARVEMLIQEWLLARTEMRDFLQSRPMVPYQEGWMGQVDTMKKLQGWSDVTVTHFRDLGVFGEQLLLSVRYGDWIGVNDPAQAANWARYWRPEVQSYIHAYRAATGVDLTGETVDSHDAVALVAESTDCSNPHAVTRVVTRGDVLDFTSALYLGLNHAHAELRPWRQLTLGKPAALSPPPESEAIADQLARLIGCERATLGTSTLHLFWDVFGQLSRERIAIYVDAGTYPIARWGVERALARGALVRGFKHHDVRALQQACCVIAPAVAHPSS